MRRPPDSLLLVPLLPIFLVGMFPILLVGLLGFAGLAIFGVLLVSVGLTSALEAHGDFNQRVIVHGFARATERSVQLTVLQTATRFAALLEITGAVLIGGAVLGFCYG